MALAVQLPEDKADSAEVLRELIKLTGYLFGDEPLLQEPLPEPEPASVVRFLRPGAG